MPNNDLISRNDVLEIIMQYCADDDGSCAKPNADLREMLDEVENIPAVDAEPVKHGKWRVVNVPKKWGGATLRCSECNTGTTNLWNYRPNCGAKMDKEKKI